MDNKQEEMKYYKEIENMKKELCNSLEFLLYEHLKSMHEKYGFWLKYPRKVKKLLKKEGFWNIKDEEPKRPKVVMNI